MAEKALSPRKPPNDKRERFCHEYLLDLNGTQAAVRAGYSEKTANEQGSRLLANSNVRARIQELMAERSKQTLVDAAYVIEGLVEVKERCMQRKPVTVWDARQKAMVQKLDEEGNNVWEFDSNGANKALELLGKHLAMFTDNVNNKHTIEQPLFGPGSPEPKRQITN
jgi:phage terminase small subunit